MVKIGFIGLGKLGLPTCFTYAYLGHQVMGYDINEKRMTYELDTVETNLHGKGSINELFLEGDIIKNNLSFTSSLEEVINFGDIIFVAIQTPHEKEFEGIERLKEGRKDFDYSYLIKAIENIGKIIKEDKIISIISTVLPGTIRKYILPILNSKIKLCYNPYFIAMGTVARDLIYTEFILLGSVDKEATEKMVEFYKTITDAPVHITTLENAELIKVTYNTFIGTKIVLANNIMELCDKLPNTDCDDVVDALQLAERRIISTQYLRGGMGDGGGCLPPDELVMTSEGMKPIIDIKVGDKVLSHNGVLRKVNKVYEREYSGDLIEINVIGQPSIKVTTDHPMLIYKNYNIVEIPANELIPNQHYIPSYKPNSNQDNYIKNIPNYINKDYCNLIALYLLNNIKDDKLLSDWVLFGPDWISKIIINKLYDVKNTFFTSYSNFAYGVQHLLNKLNINSNLNIVNNIYRVSINNNINIINNNINIKSINNRKVISTKKIPYKGKVYNIWVDIDNTYITKIGAVHNCHPRDNIALSWLSNKLDLTVNFFDMIMVAREKQTEYFSRLIIKYHLANLDLPIYLFGKAFKGNTSITTGSPAILLKNILDEIGIKIEKWYDPLIDKNNIEFKKGIYCIATRHDAFKEFKFPNDSIVIDPFRYIKQENIILHSVGKN